MRGFLSMLKNMNRPAGILMAIGLLLPLVFGSHRADPEEFRFSRGLYSNEHLEQRVL